MNIIYNNLSGDSRRFLFEEGARCLLLMMVPSQHLEMNRKW